MIGHREFNLEDYFALLRRRWWWILLPAVLGPVVGYEISLHVSPRYTSATLVVIEVPKISDSFVRPVVAGDLMSRLGTMEQEILSRDRLEPLFKRLGLPEAAAGDGLSALARTNITLAPFFSSLNNSEGKLPSGFHISCTFRSPKAAQQICANVASMFVGENALSRERSAHETTAFLKVQLIDAKRRLDEQDARLAVFKSKYINELPDQVQTNLTLLNNATIQLDGATQALSRTEADKAYTESLLTQQLAALEAQKGETAHPDSIRQQLVTLENNLANLEAKYSDDHPDIIHLKAQIEWLRKKAETEEAETPAKPKPVQVRKDKPGLEPPVVQQLRHELHNYTQAIQERTLEERRLQNQIASYQARVQLSPGIEQEYRQVTRNYQTALDGYNDLLKKVDQSAMAGALEQDQEGEKFRIVDPASLPTQPSSPNPTLFAAAGLGAGLALGLSVVLLFEIRDKSIWNERDIESCVPSLILATVPLVERRRKRLQGGRDALRGAPREIAGRALTEGASGGAESTVPEMLPHLAQSPKTTGREERQVSVPYGTPEINRVLMENCPQRSWNPDPGETLLFDGLNSAFGTEQLRALRAQLEPIRRQRQLQSLLITSPLPEEGKSFTALNLALAIACQPKRRVLLIDADMRSPELHRSLGALFTPGLSEYLGGEADDFSIIQRGGASNLFFIAAGKPALNPCDLIGNGRLSLLLRHLGPAFDWIILDSPPAVPVSDAKLLAEVCDGVLVVFRAGRTPFELARETCQQFSEKQLLGVVLNGVKPNSKYGSYYSPYYRKLTSEQTDRDRKG